jgi:hypothetical protein
MKPLAFALLMLAALPSIAQDQAITVKAGPVYSRIDGIDSDFLDAIGYHVAFGLQERLTPILGYGIDLNYTNQRVGMDDVFMSVRSANAALYAQLHAIARFSLIGGIESGIVTSMKVENERSSGDLQYRIGYVIGLSQQIADRWDAYIRYVGPIDHMQTGFDYNLQLGAAYRLWSNP